MLDEMYADPFWHERFGERALTHGRRDADFHLQYLVEALTADDEGIFLAYAIWLREVLVTRGMCSRHLAESFERLASAIAEETWPDRERAVAILRAGARALVYTSADAGAVDAERGVLAQQAAAATHAALGAAVHARCVDDLDYHLSYLADALAFAGSERFVAHVVFMVGFLGRRAISADHLRESLGSLAAVLRTQLPGITDTSFHILDAACRAIDGTPASIPR